MPPKRKAKDEFFLSVKKRTQEEQEAEVRDKELTKKRFRGAIIRGLAYGKKHVDIPATKFRGRFRPRYTGEATVWASLKNGPVEATIVYRIWPNTWREPYEITTIFDVSDVPFSIETLHMELERRSQCADAFDLSQSHVDPQKRISKAEAVVIRQFKECWNKGKQFLRSVRLLQWKPNETSDWPSAEQNIARRVLERLHNAYGKEGSRWLVAHWEDAPEWFHAEKAYIDVVLAVICGRIWHRDGPVDVRNSLKNMPLVEDPLEWDQDEFHRYSQQYMDARIVADRSTLKQLTFLSPIALAAMAGTPYSPRDVDRSHAYFDEEYDEGDNDGDYEECQ